MAAAALLSACNNTVTDDDADDPTRRSGASIYRMQIESPVYTIDKRYKSMEGPSTIEATKLGGASKVEELLWMTSYRATVVDPATNEAVSSEFMCHSAMDTHDTIYRRTFPTRMTLRGNRLFSVDQGTLQNTLPDGFGVPLLSTHELLVATQVLNHNFVGDPFDVRQLISVEFVRDAELEQPLRPLIQHGIFGLTLIDGADGHMGVEPGKGDEARHGPGCSIAEDVGHPGGFVQDRHGRRFSSFWVVPPGRHSYHTRITDQLSLPYDTSVHYAAAHLHPFAESLELFDITAGESLIKLVATQAAEGTGLANVESYSSTTGVILYTDHEYDLIAEYNNTSGTDQDAMATMLLYVLVRDLEFTTDDDTRTTTWKRVTPAALPR
jgi:hypothetical protein